MWLCDPRILCRKHLLGEHVEMHMFLGAVKKGKKIDGFLKNNLFEPRALFKRHDDLKDEMIERGYNHKSDFYLTECMCVLDLPAEKQFWEIDKERALRDLLDRCPECRQRWERINQQKSSLKFPLPA
jgi:hypothetical protein